VILASCVGGIFVDLVYLRSITNVLTGSRLIYGSESYLIEKTLQ
jgi:hypothetical protein